MRDALGRLEALIGEDGPLIPDARRSNLELATLRSGAVHRLVLYGEIDSETRADLEAAIERSMQDGARLVVLDLRGVSFLDSAGLETLCSIGEQVSAATIALELVEGPPTVQRLFRETGVLEHFQFRAAP